MEMNKRGNKLSIFWLIVSFFALSAFSIFLINNIITVNKLIREISVLKEETAMVVQISNTLKLEAEKLSSFERIKNLAEERIGLKINENALIRNKNFRIHKKMVE